jgi:adenylyl-sulfate kinase
MSEMGHVFWLFGLSGAGKTTMAQTIQRELEATGERVLMLDGDRLRRGLCHGLGFGEADRAENLRRAAEVARLGVENGFTVVAAFITPQESQRDLVESIIGRQNLSLIHIDAALEVCRQRDVKGLYARALAGNVAQMTGIGAAFEPPLRVALRLETGVELPEQSAARLTQFVRAHLNSSVGSRAKSAGT